MDPNELVGLLEELISWLKENPVEGGLKQDHARMVSNLHRQAAIGIHLLLPPGTPCTACNGTGVAIP